MVDPERIAAYKADHAVFERHRGERVRSRGPIGLRLDGRSFHTFTRDLEHPFDARFERAMDDACRALLLADLGIELAYAQSDEITVLIPRDRVPFDARLEKLLSVAAAVCSSAERQLDALKNAVSMVGHWGLILREGLTPRQAHERLQPLGMTARIALTESIGAPFSQVSPARKLGRVHTFRIVERTGHNPLTGEAVAYRRRELVCLDPTPSFRDCDRLPWSPAR